jgi:hypothetical protein
MDQYVRRRLQLHSANLGGSYEGGKRVSAALCRHVSTRRMTRTRESETPLSRADHLACQWQCRFEGFGAGVANSGTMTKSLHACRTARSRFLPRA